MFRNITKEDPISVRALATFSVPPLLPKLIRRRLGSLRVVTDCYCFETNLVSCDLPYTKRPDASALSASGEGYSFEQQT